ncbi:MAG: PTS sugar transporter subunit IIC [Deltaproteobacteria bacterium]|nr:PTS sugar transporter subunit IIC [Deltaproteobacteria bacterium]
MQAEIFVGALTVSAAGGFMSLDRTAAFQTMVSRPIVAGPVTGYLLSNIEAGLVSGMLLELLFIGDLPVGAYLPAHETALTVLVTALTAVMLGAVGSAVSAGAGAFYAGPAFKALPIALVIAAPFGRVYKLADDAARRVNYSMYKRAEEIIEKGHDISLFKENLKGALVFFSLTAAALFVTCLPLMYAAHFLAGRREWSISPALYPAFFGVLALGISASYNAAYGTRASLAAFLVAGAAPAVALAVLTR